METLKKYGTIILIVLVATWLRVWQLDSLAIFFGDAGHDILSAITAVEEQSLPLLGIESSVPRFKQGPVTVWLHMAIHLFAGKELYWYWLVFALLGTAAVIAVYEFSQLYLSPKVSLLASLLVATSPLAVAHSRMAYHITPIPLMMVLFLAAVVRLAQGKKNALFWSVLAWAGLFQFELAVTPLLLVIGYFVVRQKKVFQRSNWAQTGLAFALGLWPQIWFDLTHGFSHLGGFALWVGYRLVSLAPTGSHSFSASTITQVGNLFALYWGRMISFDQPVITILFLAALALTAYFLVIEFKQQRLAPGISVVFLATATLSVGYLLHGSPSEAYFPPFIVLLPLLLAYGVLALPKIWAKVGVALLILLALFNTQQIVSHAFFADTQHPFSYGYSLGEQRQILSYITTNLARSYYFETTQPAGVFPNFFDNLRLVAWEQGSSEDTTTGQPLFIETKDSPLFSYPGAVRIAYPSVDLYYLL